MTKKINEMFQRFNKVLLLTSTKLQQTIPISNRKKLDLEHILNMNMFYVKRGLSAYLNISGHLFLFHLFISHLANLNMKNWKL